jgi:hypothetical protein
MVYVVLEFARFMYTRDYTCPATQKKLIPSKFTALDADAYMSEAVELFEQAAFPTTVTQFCISNVILQVTVTGNVRVDSRPLLAPPSLPHPSGYVRQP